MKIDRFNIFLLVAIGLLVILSIAVYFSSPRIVEYVNDDSPSGVFTNYLIAIQSRDFQRAYQYVGEGVGKPSFSTFRSHFVDQRQEILRVSVRIIDADQLEDETVLELAMTTSRNDPFSGTYKRNGSVVLGLQNGIWKILNAPYEYWAFDWLDGSKY